MKFDMTAAARAFISRKATRLIRTFLAAFTQRQLELFIQQHKFITDFIPEQKRQSLKAKAKPYVDIIAKFTISEAYLWIPLEYRTFLESTPGGKEWAIAELEHIREFLLDA